MRLSAKRVEWSSAGIDREGRQARRSVRSVLEFVGKHFTFDMGQTHKHTQTDVGYRHRFEPVCIGQLPFYVYGVFESAAITTHTKHAHSQQFNSIQLAAKFFLRV